MPFDAASDCGGGGIVVVALQWCPSLWLDDNCAGLGWWWGCAFAMMTPLLLLTLPMLPEKFAEG